MILLLAGCGPTGPEQSALILNGWSYEWEVLAHRISYLRAGLQQDSSFELGFVGGDFSTGETATDVPWWRMRYQRVVTPYASFAHGEVEFTVGPDGIAEATATVDATGLEGREALVAVLSGFEIVTDVPQTADYPADYDPGYGYTSNGFGFTLGEPVLDGERVGVPVTAEVRWGPQDREDMNGAIPYATTGVRVAFTVIATDGDVARVPLQGDADYGAGEDPDADLWSGTEQDPMEISTSIEGKARTGFVGWTSFDLAANMTGDFAGEGEYLRALGVEAVPSARSRRAWDGSTVATITSTNLIEFTLLTAGFTGELARVGVRDAEVEDYVVEGSHPVGMARTGTTLPE